MKEKRKVIDGRLSYRAAYDIGQLSLSLLGSSEKSQCCSAGATERGGRRNNVGEIDCYSERVAGSTGSSNDALVLMDLSDFAIFLGLLSGGVG